MIATNQSLSNIMYQIHTILEKRVQERTAQLEKVNQQLQQEIKTRQLLEHKLRTSEAEIRRFFEAMTDIVLLVDREANNIQVAPTQPDRLYPPDTNIINRMIDAFYGDNSQLFLMQVDWSLKSNQIINFVYSLTLENEKKIWFSASITPISEDTVVWVGRDITERKQLEESLHELTDKLEERTVELINTNKCLEQEIIERKKAQDHLEDFAEQLKQKNQELEEFVYVASHDLQEPLRKIQTFSDRIIKKYSELLDDKGKDYINRMQNATLRMQNLINDLLALSRISSKQKPFVKVDLNEIIKEVISDLEMYLEDGNGKVIFHEFPVIEADPTQMRQLLQNLIGNGLKFHQENLQPIVEVESHIIDSNYCQIMIKDNGIGFEEKYKERIFRVFERLHPRSSYEGTGIGLSICRKIVERHHGIITVDSILGKGSTFIIHLPLSHEHN
jgi:signal transduction histidine kinase